MGASPAWQTGPHPFHGVRMTPTKVLFLNNKQVKPRIKKNFGKWIAYIERGNNEFYPYGSCIHKDNACYGNSPLSAYEFLLLWVEVGGFGNCQSELKLSRASGT